MNAEEIFSRLADMLVLSVEEIDVVVPDPSHTGRGVTRKIQYIRPGRLAELLLEAADKAPYSTR